MSIILKSYILFLTFGSILRSFLVIIDSLKITIFIYNILFLFCKLVFPQDRFHKQLNPYFLQNKLLILFLACFVGFSGFSQNNTKEKVEPLVLEFSVKGGFYADEIILEMRSPGARIYYSTDGSKPTRRSNVYNKPIVIKSTTVIRAIARRGSRKSNIKGHTFFINEPETTFPTISVLVPPNILFDPEKGLFEEGLFADTTWAKHGANFWSRREIKINYEFFETNGTCVHRSNSGLRLFGGMSRLFPQKSLALISRDNYGKKRINHRVFGTEGKKKFKFLVLRNSGSDWGKSHFRDGLMTGLVKDWDLETQDFRPAHVYINGKYWGIYNIREKLNRYFVQSHSDADKDSIDLIEHRYEVKRGSAVHYQRMLKFLERNNLKHPDKFAYLNTQMDIRNFMDYKIAQIYFDNQDAGGNIKFWRPQTSNGRWRWILYDTDWGFGLHEEKAYKNNSLAFHTKENGPGWPNPPWSTLILRKLMENPDFRNDFVNRFCDYLNSDFESQHVVQKINEHSNMLLPEMDRHLQRWNLSKKKWQHEIGVMKEFAKERPNYVRMHLMEKFNTGAAVSIQLESSLGGHVVLNDNVKVGNNGFQGKYFENIPIHLKAIPNNGYRFSHWEGFQVDHYGHSFSLKLRKGKEYALKAVFEKYIHPLANQIMINEVSANNKKTGDWVELYNGSKETVNLHNWVFTDSKNGLKLPNFHFPPDSYLVLCEDSLAFRKAFKDIDAKVIGNFGFGLKKSKEQLGLYTDKGASVDSMGYNIEPMDSTFTLSLLLPSLDNSDAENWSVLRGSGTPSTDNPFYLQSIIKAEQEMYLRIGIAVGILLVSIIVLGYRGRRRRNRQI